MIRGVHNQFIPLITSKPDWRIVICLLAGTLVRLYFGISSQIWNASHDQVVWTYSLADAKAEGVHFRHLIQYPYEGGSVLISIFTILLWSVQKIIPALSLTALLIDLTIRWFQIYVLSKVVSKQTAIWFAVWSVFAVPLMLPSSAAMFGLHSVNAIFPFVYLLISAPTFKMRFSAFTLALIFAGMIIFSYQNSLLLFAFILSGFLGWHHFTVKQWLQFFCVLLLVLVLHFWIRTHIDHGFSISPFDLFSLETITNTNFSVSEGLIHFFLFWISVLPDALSLDSAWPLLKGMSYWLFLSLIVIAAGLFIQEKKNKTSAIAQTVLVGVLFAGIYSFTKFYTEGSPTPSFYLYRHLSYIVPLLIAALFSLLTNQQRLTNYLALTFIFLCSITSILYIQNYKKQTEPAHKVAGWILSRKYGNEPKRLLHMARSAKQEKAVELYYGYGWGITANLLEFSHPNDTAQINHLQSTFVAFELPQRALMMEGLHFAFAHGVTPVLDPALLPLLESKLDSSAYLRHP
jgi:MFS family permease